MPARASEATFRAVFEPHRRAITLHCYRMTGSLQDAEEIAQETLLRAWQHGDPTGATRAWLYKVATNACLDHLVKARRRRSLPHLVAPASTSTRLGPPAEDRLWVEPAPDALLDVADDAGRRPDERISQRESVGLAFITALQFLSPRQRAALLLVDVLGWKPEETAALLETSVPSVNSLLQRARRNVEARKEPYAEVSSLDAALLQRFISAWEGGDLDAFAALLADDAILTMPPHPEWYEGREAIRSFFAAVWSFDPGQRRLLPLSANGLPGVAVYRRAPGPDALHQPSGINLLTIRGGRVAQITRFAFPRLFALFGLPPQPDSSARTRGSA